MSASVGDRFSPRVRRKGPCLSPQLQDFPRWSRQQTVSSTTTRRERGPVASMPRHLPIRVERAERAERDLRVPAIVATATTFIPASTRVAVASRAVAPVVTMSSISMTGGPSEGSTPLTENASRTCVEGSSAVNYFEPGSLRVSRSTRRVWHWLPDRVTAALRRSAWSKPRRR